MNDGRVALVKGITTGKSRGARADEATPGVGQIPGWKCLPQHLVFNAILGLFKGRFSGAHKAPPSLPNAPKSRSIQRKPALKRAERGVEMKRWDLGSEQGSPVVAKHDFKDLRSQLRQTPELRKAAALAQAEEKAKRRIAGTTKKVVFK